MTELMFHVSEHEKERRQMNWPTRLFRNGKFGHWGRSLELRYDPAHQA